MMKQYGHYFLFLGLLSIMGACSDDAPGSEAVDAGQDATTVDAGQDAHADAEPPDATFDTTDTSDISPDISPCANVECSPNEVCEDGACVEVITCDDGLKNGDEGDVDCGGSNCESCWGGQSCGVDRDCESGQCGDQGQCIPNPFETVWSTAVQDLTDSNTIHLPLVEQGNYRIRVDWGDDTRDIITQGDQAEATHRYDQPGEYTVSIEGRLQGWSFEAQQESENDAPKLLEITQWGNLHLGSSALYADGEDGGYFKGAQHLTITATDVPNLDETTSLRAMFANCDALSDIPSVAQWDVSAVTDMSYLFESAYKFNGDISAWDTSSVRDMSHLFDAAQDFNQDIGAWNTSSVQDMSYLFRNAMDFNQDIGAWDTSSVTNMSGMFTYTYDASASPYAFDQDISGWDVSAVTDMSHMFEKHLNYNRDLSGWDTSAVTDMSYMFAEARRFNQDIGGWDVSSVTNMSSMFLEAIDFNQNIGAWDTSSVTDMSYLFTRAESFDQPIGDWDVSAVTDMSYLFQDTPFNQDIGEWDVSSVTNMLAIFNSALLFNQDIGAWDTSSVTNMRYAFGNAPAFNQDISAWDTSSVTDMSYMFIDAVAFNQAIGAWDTSSVSTTEYMLARASQFDQDLGGWDLSAMTYMRRMFSEIALSTANYDALLLGWSAQQVPPGIEFGAGDSTYSAAAASARDALTNPPNNWMIEDGGPQ